MSRENPVAIGAQAQQLLDNPLLKEAHENIEKAIVDALAKVDVADTAHTLELVRALQAHRRGRTLLDQYVTHGKLAEDALEKKKLLRQPAKDPRWANWR